ncbi:MAG: penicillin-binding protein 1A [Pseudomonadota bacterium]|nr:penicillin-binding protein 1A [Pseudomonadota bacterium]
MKKLSCAGLIYPFFSLVCALLCVLVLSIPIGFYGMYLYLAPTLPDMARLQDAQIEMPLQVYTRDDKLIGEFGEKQSEPVAYQQIPEHMVHAFLAAEDASFFSHSGVSFKGLGRAITEAVQSGSTQTGGSTITMQVAKNYYLSPERTLRRKLTEIFLARKIEQTLSKEEIFTLYVNKIFLGQNAYGISAAARIYYNKSLDELSIAEMAMIAGLPKAPSRYNPVANPERALERRNWIIGRMLQLGYISQQAYQAAITAPVGLNMHTKQLDLRAPYLAEMVRGELVNNFGTEAQYSGWRVYTTVHSERQEAADQAVKRGLEAYDRRHGWRGAEAHDKPLNSFVVVGDLQPAKVTQVLKNSFKAELQDGSVVTVPWSGMSWARRYYNANRAGGTPANASQIVKAKDIVRLRSSGEDDARTWSLVQIPAVQGQLIALNPDNGAIEAVVGGYDFAASKFNRSIQGWRQPGSAIKPFVYSLALERGFSPQSPISDAPLQVGKWRPKNSDGRFLGDVTLRRALYLSRNLVSIRLLQSVGIDRARRYLVNFGMVEQELPRNLTLALGTAQVLPVQIATGYAAFANGGYRVQPHFIERIEDYHGNVLYRANPATVCRDCAANQPPESPSNPLIQAVAADDAGMAVEPTIDETKPSAPPTIAIYKPAERIVKAEAAYDMANILRDVVQVGTARAALKLGRNDIAGKTGTTNDAKDAWFSGFHPTLVAVAWVGFDQPRTLGRREYGGVAALPIWSAFMGKALADVPEQWITRQGALRSAEKNRSEIDQVASEDDAQRRIEARAKAPPMGIVIRRPTPPPRPVAPQPSSIDPTLPVTRLTPGTVQSGSYREGQTQSSQAQSNNTAPRNTTPPANRVTPDQIF